MILKFHGAIAFGDTGRVAEAEDALHGSVHIGGADVVYAIHEASFANPITIAIADERYSGPLAVELGYGYSEWTPVEDDALTVGPHNIIEVLNRYEAGQIVTMWAADEPFNTID